MQRKASLAEESSISGVARSKWYAARSVSSLPTLHDFH